MVIDASVIANESEPLLIYSQQQDEPRVDGTGADLRGGRSRLGRTGRRHERPPGGPFLCHAVAATLQCRGIVPIPLVFTRIV